MLRRGRLEREMEPSASEFISSMQADVRIFEPVVHVNLAHVVMLAERRIISEQDATALLRALLDLHKRGIEALELRPELEDIHMAVEEFVTKATSKAIGGKLNTAKSRNDQVAAAIRMALRKDLLGVQEALLQLIANLIALTEKNVEVVMPGYTHLQTAEPTTFANYLAAYAWTFLRDVERLGQAYESTNSCPMGACALAGTSFPIDRMRVARLLGFRRIDENAMDAVGARDFTLQAMAGLAIAMGNLSRLAEELVLWSSAEFGMIEMPEEFVATSSIMPQKKNPVIAELVRAKAGRVSGNLLGALAVTKALPQAYNLDLQELTPLLWSSVDETRDSAAIIAKIIDGIEPKREVMRKRAEQGFTTATELADLLVREAGLAFRDAHAVVGRMVTRAVDAGKGLRELELEDLRAASREVVGKEVEIASAEFRRALDVEECVRARVLPGGPAPKAIKEQLKSLKRETRNFGKLMRARRRAIAKSEAKLIKEAKRRLR